VTTGGGGMLLIQDEKLAARAKYLSTTAKKNHPWEFFHTEVGYNYRMPNINAALGCAQLNKIESFLANKRETHLQYKQYFSTKRIGFISEASGTRANFWLNAIKFNDRESRDKFLQSSNERKVLTRPIWELMVDLPAFKNCQSTSLNNAKNYVDTIVNVPSGVRLKGSM
jgi:dTDP-4-amino-4,6-dideoxygalactose transaminase